MGTYGFLCNACRQWIASSQGRRTDRASNCLTLGDDLVGERPAACWLDSGRSHAVDALQTLGTTTSGGSIDARRRQIAHALLSGLRGEALHRQLVQTCEPIKRRLVTNMALRLPPASPLHAALLELRDRLPPLPHGAVLRFDDALPAEFERAVAAYEVESRKIQQRKRERGYGCHPSFSTRRVIEARRWCEFLVRRGRERWFQVTQGDFDAYSATGFHFSSKVFPFVRFVRTNFRMPARLIRPRRRNSPALDRIADHRRFPDLLRKILAEQNPQVALAGLFLALYAQPIARSAKLCTSDFRERGGRLEAMFAQAWMPLDRVTAARLRALHPTIGRPINAQSRPIFSYCESYLVWSFNRITPIEAKKVRMGAIAAVLGNGVTHRGTISALLGVCLKTVEVVEQTLPWDLQQTVATDIVDSRNQVLRTGSDREEPAQQVSTKGAKAGHSIAPAHRVPG